MNKSISRIIARMLVLTLFLQTVPINLFANELNPSSVEVINEVRPFNDIEEGAWYYDSVLYALENNLFSGVTEYTFAPQGTMTRGMYVTVLARLAGVDLAPYSEQSSFQDVDKDAWYAPSVAWAVEKKITAGVGEGKFAPDALVTREQMAVLTDKYFTLSDIPLPEAVRADLPKDAASLSDWARESMLKMWECGLIQGDEAGNINGKKHVTRAESAAYFHRVDTYLIESGIKGVLPEEVLPEQDKDSDDHDDTEIVNYYKVDFELGDIGNIEGITLPEDKLYAKGTAIKTLPTPTKPAGMFLGWYYDKEMTARVPSDAVLSKNMTLYANFAEGEDFVAPIESPNYITIADAALDFSFLVSTTDQHKIADELTITNVTDGNAEVALGACKLVVQGGQTLVQVPFEEGQTYEVVLDNESDLVFTYNGIAQPLTIRILNIITEKDEVLNLTLDESIKYISVDDVENMTGDAVDGLIQFSVSSTAATIDTTTSTGTFDYHGEGLEVGDTVALYSGLRPDRRTLATQDTSEDGEVVYVTISEVEGVTYTYVSAESEDVMFTPDILPLSSTLAEDDQIIEVPASIFTFDTPEYAEMGLDYTTTIDKGDFIAFYEGELTRTTGTPDYARIQSVSFDGAVYTVVYEEVTFEEVMATMDIYSEKEVEVDFTEEEIAEMEHDLETQAMESGFIDEATTYLATLALETDSFETLSEEMNLESYTMEVQGDTQLLAKGARKATVEVVNKEVTAKVKSGRVLQYFDGSSGVRAELYLNFTLEITGDSGNKIQIDIEAIFEQEILLSVNASGGAIWKWKWIFPYIWDYRLNANLDVGAYTGIGITATMQTVGAEEEVPTYDWKPTTGHGAEQKLIDIGQQITALMEEADSFMGSEVEDEEDEDHTVNTGSLAEKYAEMIENAEESWIEVVRKEVFSVRSSVDPFHILVYGISMDFVVSANVYVTVGMTFKYAEAKRYNFSFLVFRKEATSKTIVLEEANYQFEFYVMGTLGIRAGLEIEIAVGLFSLNLASIGITAEVGAYAQMWGYFYYTLKWSESSGRASHYAGAMLVEIGIYLKITFKAQIFSSSKLTYQPVLYDKAWPIWSVGARYNTYDFASEEDDEEDLAYSLYETKQLKLPKDLFTMGVMDLKTGELSEKNYSTQHFTVSFTNPAFSFDARTNLVKVSPINGSLEEEGDMMITWKGAPLAMTSTPIQEVIEIEWSDPDGGYYIAFDANGGTSVEMIYIGPGGQVTKPADPEKKGYDFAGWYSDEALTLPYTFPEVMPNKSVIVYAKWAPKADRTYVVEHYTQSLTNPNAYDLAYVQTYQDGITDSVVTPATLVYEGFETPAQQQLTILEDNSAVLKYYYDREAYTVTFTYGELHDETDESTAPIVETYRYGETVSVPVLAKQYYFFRGFEGLNTEQELTMPAQNMVYDARWEEDPVYTYTIEHFVKDVTVEEGIYVLDTVQPKVGAYGDVVVLEDLMLSGDHMEWIKTEVNGELIETTEVKVDQRGLVVKMYYDNDRAMQEVMVEHYTQNVDGTYKLEDEAIVYGEIDQQVKAKLNHYPHFKFNPQAPDTVASGKVPEEGTLVLKVYYDRLSYTITMYDDVDDVGKVTAKHGVEVDLPEREKEGYVFDGWYVDEHFENIFKGIMPTENTDVYAKWTQVVPGEATYKVKHYKETVNGGYDLTDTDEHTGLVGEWVEGDLKVYPYFTYQATTTGGLVTTPGGIVTTSPALELKYYYDRDTYTITFANEEFEPIKQKHGTKVDIGTIEKPGYSFGGWYTDSAYNNTFDGIMPTADTTLYAKWQSEDEPDTSWYNESDTHFTLNTHQQLQGLAQLVDEGNNFDGKTILLGQDINLSAIQWNPIGTRNNPFRGIFDGQNHVIYGLNILTESGYTGFFAYLDNATVKNLGLDDVTIKSSGIDVGGLAGHAEGSHIENCYVTGLVEGERGVGGFVGSTDGAVTKLINVYSHCTLKSSGYTDDVAGIVGWNTSSSVSVRDSYTASIGERRGLVGWSDGSDVLESNIINAWYDNTLSPNTDGHMHIGKTTEDLQSAATFSSWNKAVWSIQEGQYPVLRAFMN